VNVMPCEDLSIAMATADKLVQHRHVFIFHDVRRRTGSPCPLPYDWNRKNMVGITVGKNVHRARCWAITALMFGYEVLGHHRKDTAAWAYCPGTIARIRQRKARK